MLPSKTEAIYTRFFREVIGQINEPVVTDILVDFERGATNAIWNANQDIEVKGCFYHLCSNVWKRIQHLRLQQSYNDDQKFSLHLKMLCALAFLPLDDVVQGFEDFTSELIIRIYIRHFYWSPPKKSSTSYCDVSSCFVEYVSQN